MKKIKVLLIVLLLLSCTVSFAEKATMNDGEIAAYVLNSFAGEGTILEMPKVDDNDTINARYIFIKDPVFKTDLAVMIRITETELAFWSMELNRENLLIAQLALSEEAPFCLVAVYENGEIKDSATYMKKLNSVVTYDSFKSNVNDLIESLTPEGVLSEMEQDPFLAVFPGYDFSMNKTAFIKQYSGFDINDAGDAVGIKTTIDGAPVSYLITFSSNKTKDMIIAISKDHIKQYKDKYTEVYGKPIRTSFSLAMLGMPEETPDGDTYVWKKGTINILLHDELIYYIN